MGFGDVRSMLEKGGPFFHFFAGRGRSSYIHTYVMSYGLFRVSAGGGAGGRYGRSVDLRYPRVLYWGRVGT